MATQRLISPEESPRDLEPFFCVIKKEPGSLKRAEAELYTVIMQFATKHNIKAIVERTILNDVIKMYNRDLGKMNQLDGVKPCNFRQAAALAIWIVRLKPLMFVQFDGIAKEDVSRHKKIKLITNLNEVLGLYLSFAIIQASSISKCNMMEKLWTSDFDDLLSILRYRAVSRHTIELFLKLIQKK